MQINISELISKGDIEKIKILLKELRDDKSINETVKINILIKQFEDSGILSIDDKDLSSRFARKLLGEITEDDLIGVVDYLRRDANDLFSNYRSVVGIGDIRDILDKEILDDKELIKEMIKNGSDNFLRSADLKEAIGWIAGHIYSESFTPEKIEFLEDGKINKRQTIKNLLKQINKMSVSSNKPFATKLKRAEKETLMIIKMYCDKKGGKYCKTSKIPDYQIVIQDLIDKGYLDEKFKIKMSSTERRRIEISDTVKMLKSLSDQELNNYIDNTVKFNFYPAGSGEIDVLSQDGKKVMGMSITTDLTTHIEQNQFVRHFMKTLVFSYLKNNKEQDIKNLNDAIIPVKRKGSIVKKRLSDCKFWDLLNYWRYEKKYKPEDKWELSLEEMDMLIKDGEKYSTFIFYGEINTKINKNMRDEIAGFLMLAYVNNLRSIGNVDMSPLTSYRFLSNAMISKFNDVDNGVSHIRMGLKAFVNFVNEDKTILFNKKYSEGSIYKTEREDMAKGIYAISSIIREIKDSTETEKDFRESLRDFFVNEGISLSDFELLLEKIDNGTIYKNIKGKLKSFYKGESETSEAENFLLDLLKNSDLFNKTTKRINKCSVDKKTKY